MDTENKNKIKVNLQFFEDLILAIIIFLIPLVVLPIFPNSFDTPKLGFLVFGVIFLILLKAVKTISGGKVKFSIGKFDIGVLLLGLSYVISTMIQSPNKMDAVLLPGTTTAIVGGAILYFLINQAKNKKFVEHGIVASGVIMVVVILLSITGVLSALPGIGQVVGNASGFNTLGGVLPSLIFFATVVPLAIYNALNKKDMATKAFYGISSALLVFGVVIAGFYALPGRNTSPKLPDFTTGWTVAIDTLKVSPLLGVGPGNYVSAFNRFRPLSYNQTTDNWQLRFTSSRSHYVTLLTEVGVVGLAAMGLIILSFVRTAKASQRQWRGESERKFDGSINLSMAYIISLGILFVLLLVFPATPALVVLMFVFLALITEAKTVELSFLGDSNSRFPAIVVTTPMILGAIAVGYLVTRILIAEAIYRKAIDAVAANDGRAAYETLQKAINTNPYVDRYRVSYSQVNLALANNIAAKQDVTESDRDILAQLVQQAIREGKAAVTLNPQKASNWEILASIYGAIIPLAQGADVFAFQTYSQAIALDPINPNTRIALGGLLYSAKNYKDAIDVFKLAVLAKPDLANAHYNLAAAYREDGQIDRAISEMSIVVSLVESGTQDYEVAAKELESLQTKKKESEGAAKTGETLTPPEGPAGPAIEPKLELEEGSEPPTPKDTPTPTQAPEETPTPTMIP